MIQCKNVISTVGLANTYEKLLPEQFKADPEFQYFSKNIEYGQPLIYLFVGFKGNSKELNMPSCNYLHI